jgi:TrmH family RNA methyltransferase
LVITSVSNAKVKFAHSLARKKERAAANKFVVEGTRLVQEAVRAGLDPALVLYERAAMDTDPRARALVTTFQKQTSEVYEVSAAVMQALSETETPQGLAVVLPLPQLAFPSILERVLVLDRVRDPGNLGAILRIAWAANVSAVLLAPETADAWSPKVVRAAMGAHFNVPLRVASWDGIEQALQEVPRIYLADARGDEHYTEVDWALPLALIIGGEAEGAGERARRLATATVSIPMPGNTESLNAAVSTGILLFECLRQQAK